MKRISLLLVGLIGLTLLLWPRAWLCADFSETAMAMAKAKAKECEVECEAGKFACCYINGDGEPVCRCRGNGSGDADCQAGGNGARRCKITINNTEGIWTTEHALEDGRVFSGVIVDSRVPDGLYVLDNGEILVVVGDLILCIVPGSGVEILDR